MNSINTSEINFSDSAVSHFTEMLKKRGKGEGIIIGIKKAGRLSNQNNHHPVSRADKCN